MYKKRNSIDCSNKYKLEMIQEQYRTVRLGWNAKNNNFENSVR